TRTNSPDSRNSTGQLGSAGRASSFRLRLGDDHWAEGEGPASRGEPRVLRFSQDDNFTMTMTIHKRRPSTRAVNRGLEIRRVLANEIAERFHVLHRSFWKNAVTEIEDVAGASGGLAQNVFSSRFELLPIGEEQHRIEIALHCAFETKAPPSRIERNAPVEAYNFGASFLHRG